MTLEELNNLLDEVGTLVVAFTAPSWCHPCRALKPHYDAASKESTRPFFTIDVDEAQPVLMEKFNIMTVPTIIEISSEHNREIKGRTAVTILQEVG